MSSFLDRLVRTALHPETTVQPRMPSRFESSGAPEPLADDIAASAATASTAAGAPAEGVPKAAAAPPFSTARIAEGPPPIVTDPQPVKDVQPRWAETSGARSATPPGSERLADVVNTGSARPIDRGSSEARTSSQLDARPEIRAVVGRSPKVKPPREVPPDADAGAGPRSAGAVSPLDTRGEPSTRIGQPTRKDPPAIARPAPGEARGPRVLEPSTNRAPDRPDRRRQPVERRLETRADGSPPATRRGTPSYRKAGDDPVIHVTIGRVEVRATIAGGSEPKRAARSPALGLDQYLRQRNGGRE